MNIIRRFSVALWIFFIVGIALIAYVSFAVWSEPEGIKIQKQRATAVATTWLAKNAPKDSEFLKYEVLVVDLGKVWGVTFVPPGKQFFIGGVGPELSIDKKSYEILDVGWGQ